MICLSVLRQFIDLRNTDKSQNFKITEFNNCFIIRLPKFVFIFKSLSDSSGKHGVKDGIKREQTLICRQLS